MMLRFSLPRDEPGLKRLWKTVFQDDDRVIDGFFREVYTPGMAYVAEETGVIAAGAYVVPFGRYRYIFAVATLPEYRGRGLGKAVTLGAADGKAAWLCPAEPSLRTWYASMGFVPVSHRRLPERVSLLRELTPEEYMERRELLLRGTPHAEYTLPLLKYFTIAGKLYETENGIAAVDGGGLQEVLPCPADGEPYIYALHTSEPLYWGITLA